MGFVTRGLNSFMMIVDIKASLILTEETCRGIYSEALLLLGLGLGLRLRVCPGVRAAICC